jgi:multidrug efflux pump subunit AcrA (membrane-fusion protein)
VAVTVTAARRADFVTSVSATGTVASLREAKIASKLSGIVETVFVTEGQRVQSGAPLLRLGVADLVASDAQARAAVQKARAELIRLQNGARPEERRQAAAAVAQAEAEVRSAQANVTQAAATLDLAQANVQRKRTLYQTGLVSKQDLDSAEAEFRQAQAGMTAASEKVRQAQAALESSRQAQRLVESGPRWEEIASAKAQLAQAEAALVSAQVQLREATVTAPFAGTITQRNVEPGEGVSSSSPAFILAQLDDVHVELTVPEGQRPGLRVGQTVEVTVDALPGLRFAGKLAEIRPAAATASRSFVVKVRVPNPQGVLRPGMFARGTIIVSTRPHVLRVPARAVLTTAAKPLVFVVRDGKATHREVTLGERRAGLVEVLRGLTEGEQVVVSGVAGLSDGQAVTLRGSQ